MEKCASIWSNRITSKYHKEIDDGMVTLGSLIFKLLQETPF